MSYQFKILIFIVLITAVAGGSLRLWQEIQRPDGIVALIKEEDIGEGHYNFRDGKLYSSPYGRIHIASKSPLIVRVENGGGHLSSQGYVFAEDCEDSSAFDQFFSESITFQQLNSDWWKYWSKEG